MLPENDPIVITGMAVNTPLADRLDLFLEKLLAGESAITCWKAFDTSRIYCKVGGDLSAYDVDGKVGSLVGAAPEPTLRKLRMLMSKSPWPTRLSLLVALDGAVDANLFDGEGDPEKRSAIVAGHNLNLNHHYENHRIFDDEPDYMDPLLAVTALDTDHAASISELLDIQGPIYTVGAACASGNTALRCAVDELRHHEMEQVVVTGAVLDFSPLELHAMALMGAISFVSFNDEPEKASRPFDARREGFVPAHGAGTLVLERMETARRRGARIYAELLGVEANADARRLPVPSQQGQVRLIRRLLRQCHLAPEQVDFVSAHATSTPLGDVTEIRSIREVFGSYARSLRINAPKSMLGHTCWAAPIVETIAAVLQLQAGRLHPSINVESLDPEVDLDICRDGAVEHPAQVALKNAFGFGGINCASLLRLVS